MKCVTSQREDFTAHVLMASVDISDKNRAAVGNKIMQSCDAASKQQIQWYLQHRGPKQHFVPSVLRLWFQARYGMDFVPLSLFAKQGRL